MMLRGLLLFALFALFASAALASAQGTKTPAAPPQAKQSGQPPASKTPASKTPATKATDAKTAGGTGTKAAAPGAQRRPTLAVAPEAAPVAPPVILREVFGYDGGGRRDPFFTLLATAELRPAITDLKLIGIAYDETGRRSVAILRDIQTRTQYRVTTGMLLGRMRVALIKRKAVIFSIEEFGLNRQDSLIIGDTTKARAK